jgi:hypothetical protein
MSVLAVSISDTPPYTEDNSICENGAHFILLPVYIKSGGGKKTLIIHIILVHLSARMLASCTGAGMGT